MSDSGVGERPLRVNPVIAIRHAVPNGVKASDTTAVAPAAAHADGERLVVAGSIGLCKILRQWRRGWRHRGGQRAWGACRPVSTFGRLGLASEPY